MPSFISFLQSFNQLLSAGIAITAFSLLLYALSFNLRDRVASTFALILVCVVIVFVGETFASVAGTPQWVEVWLEVQWVGIILLPPAYLQFSLGDPEFSSLDWVLKYYSVQVYLIGLMKR